ncbi:hypothetical protein ACQP2E_21320 [Actinoplanes sp. CA-015351]
MPPAPVCSAARAGLPRAARAAGAGLFRAGPVWLGRSGLRAER